ncbi:MAG: hypothetical protein OXH96_07055 [Spirochaetaceae bacterium]|nr:hypothetical protein [Spirochaetaceae bacterium]
MDDFEVLYDLLRGEALAPVENLRGRPKTITLEESGQQGYVLKLLGTPNDTIAFKADKFPPPKRSTREPRAPVHDNPADMLTMSAPKGIIHFRKLL